MTNLPLSLARALLLPIFAAVAGPAHVSAQDWIWSGRNAGERDVCYFRKPFHLGAAPEKAVLSVACDNKATIYLDGKAVGENDNWGEATVLDLTKLLKAGDHLLAIRAENDGGPGGLLAMLDVSLPDSKKQTVLTDTSWQVSTKEIAGWNKPDSGAG